MQHKQLLLKFVNNIHKKNIVHKLLEKKDKILIGISGGKDSLLLFEILGELKKDLSTT